MPLKATERDVYEFFSKAGKRSGCVACYREPRSTETPLNDPVSSSIAQTVKKPTVSGDLWSTSTVDMDNVTFTSQGGSISSS
ncbi:hypothetical protein Bca4012_036912 [Brassica carinata]